MSNFSAFMKSNKKQRQNELYAATKSLTDENGVPLLWELRPVTTRENEAIREQCTTEVQVAGKPGMYRQRVDTSEYQAKLMAAAVVITLPILIISLCLQKYVVSGMTAGAVKG